MRDPLFLAFGVPDLSEKRFPFLPRGALLRCGSQSWGGASDGS